MSAIVPVHPNNPPRNGRGYWIYVDPETGQEFKHPYFDQLRSMASKHRLANNLPIGVEWRAQFEENVCKNTPDVECYDTTPPPKPTLSDLVKSAFSATVKWAKDGFRVVSDEKLIERRTICEGCDFWAGDGAYFGLGKCAKCGCSGLKLFLPTEKCPIRKW